MLKDLLQYHAFMLRCWEVRSAENNHIPSWRFSLENARTGEKHAFPNFQAMVEFLQLNFSIEGSDDKESHDE